MWHWILTTHLHTLFIWVHQPQSYTQKLQYSASFTILSSFIRKPSSTYKFHSTQLHFKHCCLAMYFIIHLLSKVLSGARHTKRSHLFLAAFPKQSLIMPILHKQFYIFFTSNRVGAHYNLYLFSCTSTRRKSF